MKQVVSPTFPIFESRKLLDEIPFGEVETFWIEVDRAIYVDDAYSVETRARAAGIQMLFSEYGPVFRTTLPVVSTESNEDKQDRQFHADEVVDHVEWLLSGTTAVIPRPDALLDSLKLLTNVPRRFVGDSVPNTGAQLVEASLDAARKKLNPAVCDLIVLYLSQLSRSQTGESAEETVAFIKEYWELGDVGAAEKHRERTTTATNFDWVAQAERLED